MTLEADHPGRLATSSANAPLMQNPITPTVPVQSPDSASCARVASMWSNAGPRWALSWANVPFRQVIARRPRHRSGIATT